MLVYNEYSKKMVLYICICILSCVNCIILNLSTGKEVGKMRWIPYSLLVIMSLIIASGAGHRW